MAEWFREHWGAGVGVEGWRERGSEGIYVQGGSTPAERTNRNMAAPKQTVMSIVVSTRRRRGLFACWCRLLRVASALPQSASVNKSLWLRLGLLLLVL